MHKLIASLVTRSYEDQLSCVVTNEINFSGERLEAHSGIGRNLDVYFKDANDPTWKDDTGFKVWSAFMDRYYPGGDRNDGDTVFGYLAAQTLVQVLKQCGDDLTRENVMKEAANLKELKLDMLLPGISINTSPTDFYPIKQQQMIKFDGEHWEPIGPVMSGEIGG